MGKALREALHDFDGIKRYGYAVIPMDESLCMFACDLGGQADTCMEGKAYREDRWILMPMW